jgi:TetR/AcrR family transcriptional regulator, regulator of cefoperazone and chloramphenicol sensitivity
MKNSSESDEGTKTRLIEAAGEVFARHGFRAATIRGICRRAHASVSAVNYHFRDKKGLYAAVFEYSHRLAVEKYPQDLGLEEGAAPVQRLRAFIRSLLLRLLGDGFSTWHGKLIAQEISDPSGVLSQVAETSIRPVHEYLEGIVRSLLKDENPSRGDDSGVARLCAMSVLGQCIFQYHARQFAAVDGPGGPDPAEIDALSDHITRFSMGGIREIAAGRLPG